jgi:hypothetical protein
MLTLFISVAFVIWFALSILNQFGFKRFQELSARFDKCLFIPKWTFFAPHPGCSDYRIIYRTFDCEEQKGGWSEICLIRERRWRDAFWNPDKRMGKGVFDLAQTCFIVRRFSTDATVLMTSVAYIMLARYVESHTRGCAHSLRQFAIVETHGIYSSKAPNVLLESGVHRVVA